MDTNAKAAWELDPFWKEVVSLMTGDKKLRSDAYLQRLSGEELDSLLACLSSPSGLVAIREVVPKWRGGRYDGQAPSIGTLSPIAAAIRQKHLLNGLERQQMLNAAVKERGQQLGLDNKLVDTVLVALSEEALKRQASGMADGFLPKAANALLKREKQMLEQKKFQRETVKLFIIYAEDQEAQRLATSNMPTSEKTELLGQRLFGKDWE